MLFGGVFKVIFKNYLASHFTSDSGIAGGFINFRAISKDARGRFLNFDLVFDLWDFEVGSSTPKSGFLGLRKFFGGRKFFFRLKRWEIS